MRILLLSMPDSFEHTPSLTIRMPNGALASLAGNVDPHHHVAIADLILAQATVRETVTDLIATHQPDLVGLSIMTFQRRTALRIIRLIRRLRPGVRIVIGGYDPTLATEATSPSAIWSARSSATRRSRKWPGSPTSTAAPTAAPRAALSATIPIAP
jgi:anaerobic magnesium-protoporphyrin IX monomethyl ester cyclase